MGRLEDKVAIITGAASGIGRATALLFAREGAKVVVADVVSGEEVVEMIKQTGGEAIFVKTDVSKATEVERMVKSVVDNYGKLDIIFNNAGIGGTLVSTMKRTEEEWDKVINVNLKGVFLGMKYAIREMLNKGGVIINTSSYAGLVGTAGIGAYSASKSGVIALTKTAAVEYAKRNIRVNAICPGGILTQMTQVLGETDFKYIEEHTPMARVGKPEEVATVALFLASDESSFITGAVLSVDGGAAA